VSDERRDMLPAMKSKIFVDGRVFDTAFQGTRTYIQNIYSVIDKIGDFEVYIGSQNPEKTATYFEGSDIKFPGYKYSTGNKIGRAFLEIPELIKKYKIDIAHFQYISAPVKNCKQIVTIHDILFKDFPEQFPLKYRLQKGPLFWLSAKRADLLTTVSSYSKLALHNHYSIPLNKIHVVPNGVSEVYFQPYVKSDAQQAIFEKYKIADFILFVSRLEPRKNHLHLLNAYVDLKLYEKNKALVFIGKRDLEVPAISMALNNLSGDIKKNIYFLENIPDDELLQFYKACDLFVYPSEAEGFGIPPLEAGALKKPVICSNTTAMKDFSFFNEYHIAPSYQPVKAALQKEIMHPLPETALEAISNIIKDNYGWENAAEKLNSLITKLLKTS
jgi:glycosyltransferase involved in cell wall biosynthesis